MNKVQALLETLGLEDEVIEVKRLAQFCESCAEALKGKGVESIHASLILEAILEAEPWGKLPKGWTEDSLKSFWKSLTGDREHKISACIKKMKDSGVSDPEAFCGSLASKMGYR